MEKKKTIDKDFDKALDEEIRKAIEEMDRDNERALEEFNKTEEAKEIDKCKTPEDFRRVTEKYHPDWVKDGVVYYN